MAHLRYGNSELLAKYSNAQRDYARAWRHIDEMIRKVVDENSASTFAAVHTKVVLIDSVYRTQLNRAIRVGADQKVADALNTPEVNSAISRATELRRFGHETLPTILNTHAALLTAVGAAFSSEDNPKSLRSFASKYLHFHTLVTPILDSLASDAISKFTDLDPIDERVSDLEIEIPETAGFDSTYRWYTIRFLALTEHLASLNVRPTIKDVDHMLWTEKVERERVKRLEHERSRVT